MFMTLKHSQQRNESESRKSSKQKNAFVFFEKLKLPRKIYIAPKLAEILEQFMFANLNKMY